MVTPMTESNARLALATVQSEASNPKFYAARRREHGWLFVWRIERGTPPVGTRGWVVADSGRARVLQIGERADEVIAEELAKGPAADD